MFGLKSTESGNFIKQGIPFGKLRVTALPLCSLPARLGAFSKRTESKNEQQPLRNSTKGTPNGVFRYQPKRRCRSKRRRR